MYSLSGATLTVNSHYEAIHELRRILKGYRLSSRLTMREVASCLGKPHSYVQRVENGDRRLDVVEFIWYSACIGCDPSLLLQHLIDNLLDP